jgi:hypothetical protein
VNTEGNPMDLPRYHAPYQTAMVAALFVNSADAAELMPYVQQNALVQKHCAVCHTDAAKNGGLSLEHFDAAKASPSLTAMLLSKLTGGVSLKTASEAAFDTNAAALIEKKMKSGAMGAAGIPVPNKAVTDALNTSIHGAIGRCDGLGCRAVERRRDRRHYVDGKHSSRGSFRRARRGSRVLQISGCLQPSDAGGLYAVKLVADAAERSLRRFCRCEPCDSI